MNTVIVIGNLTDDPTMKYAPSGDAVTDFSIAINNGKDRDGNERPPTYLDIVAWERTAENVAEYCRRGSKVAVQGAITVEKYTDREEIKRTKYRIRAFSVEFLTPKSAEGGARRDDRDDRPPSRATEPSRRAPRDDLDDLPF